MLDHNLKMKFYILLLIQNLAFVYNKVAFFPDFRWAWKDFAFQFSTLVLVLPTERVVSFGRMKVLLGKRVAPTVELMPVMPSLRHRHYIKVPFCSRFPGHASGRLFCEYCNWLYCAAERAIEPLAAEELKHKKSREFDTWKMITWCWKSMAQRSESVYLIQLNQWVCDKGFIAS